MKKGKGQGMGMQNMLAQVQKMQADLERAQQELAEETVEASAGGGAVKVVMSGTQECHKVEISPELLAEADAEMVQDLVLLAVNQALQDSRLLAARKLGPMGDAMGMLGLG